jgi:hypothetical protein
MLRAEDRVQKLMGDNPARLGCGHAGLHDDLAGVVVRLLACLRPPRVADRVAVNLAALSDGVGFVRDAEVATAAAVRLSGRDLG